MWTCVRQGQKQSPGPEKGEAEREERKSAEKKECRLAEQKRKSIDGVKERERDRQR